MILFLTPSLPCRSADDDGGGGDEAAPPEPEEAAEAEAEAAESEDNDDPPSLDAEAAAENQANLEGTTTPVNPDAQEGGEVG